MTGAATSSVHVFPKDVAVSKQVVVLQRDKTLARVAAVVYLAASQLPPCWIQPLPPEHRPLRLLRAACPRQRPQQAFRGPAAWGSLPYPLVRSWYRHIPAATPSRRLSHSLAGCHRSERENRALVFRGVDRCTGPDASRQQRPGHVQHVQEITVTPCPRRAVEHTGSLWRKAHRAISKRRGPAIFRQ